METGPGHAALPGEGQPAVRARCATAPEAAPHVHSATALQPRNGLLRAGAAKTGRFQVTPWLPVHAEIDGQMGRY